MIPLLLSLLVSHVPVLDPGTPSQLWWGDYNGDGRLDVVRAAPGAPARLLENRGAGEFADVSTAVGWPVLERLAQVAFVNLETDPAAELALVADGRVRLFEHGPGGLVFRARTRLQDGRARIALPEDFRLVSEPDELTVQLTPVGNARVWIERYDLDEVLIGGESDVEVRVLVNGIRRGYRAFETLRDNHNFIPEERGVPYGTQYPEDYRRILVENGTLEPDFTPNETTAARLGWVLRNPVMPAGETSLP